MTRSIQLRAELEAQQERDAAGEAKAKLCDQKRSLPFSKVVSCNIGNPQALAQKPITFFRQVLALCTYPELLESESTAAAFPSDAIARAKEYLAMCSGRSTGAYSHSMGLRGIREQVAAFIAERDGYPSDPDTIFLTNGASTAVQMGLNLLIAGPNDGVMVPVPQYPLYSASIDLFGGKMVSYDLNESKSWGTSLHSLEEAYEAGRKAGVRVRALVVINPGNPTGQCLDPSVMRSIVKFCSERNLVLMADEVYQTNIYAPGKTFVSFKKIRADLKSKCVLFSFHSTSKGFLGECGRRGGYVEVCGIDDKVKAQLYKLASVCLCSNVDGQIMTGLMTRPPRKGDPSYALYARERGAILESLRRRAGKIVEGLNKLDGVTCNAVEGALYAFPRVRFSKRALAAAEAKGVPVDKMYVLAMLEETGVVVVPGSGFRQEEGTFHFRITILPPESEMEGVIRRVSAFHERFVQKYS